MNCMTKPFVILWLEHRVRRRQQHSKRVMINLDCCQAATLSCKYRRLSSLHLEVCWPVLVPKSFFATKVLETLTRHITLSPSLFCVLTQSLYVGTGSYCVKFWDSCTSPPKYLNIYVEIYLEYVSCIVAKATQCIACLTCWIMSYWFSQALFVQACDIHHQRCEAQRAITFQWNCACEKSALNKTLHSAKSLFFSMRTLRPAAIDSMQHHVAQNTKVSVQYYLTI